MVVPEYYAKRPEMGLDEGTLREFERLYGEQMEGGTGREIEYGLSVPKWMFLCWLCEAKDVVLHGSGDGAIEEFEPRQPGDEGEFSGQKAVFAASDGLWPMFFAVVNRDGVGGPVQSLVNACFRLVEEDGGLSDPYYFLSINGDALEEGAVTWRDAWIYLLPKGSFVQSPREKQDGGEIDIQEWASLVPVKPLAKIRVGPGDFPLLKEVRGHDLKVIIERIKRNPGGFPWLEPSPGLAPV